MKICVYLKTTDYSLTAHSNVKFQFDRDTCVNFIKTIFEALHNDAIDNMKQIWFITIMSDGSRDSILNDQEATLLKYIMDQLLCIKCLK
jgi:hypothetical protein